jgi:hypothetical protein
VQLAIADRIAMQQLRLALLDEKAANGITLTDAEEKSYVSLTSGVIRAMKVLGLQPKAPPRPSLANHFAKRAAERAAAEAAARGTAA